MYGFHNIAMRLHCVALNDAFVIFVFVVCEYFHFLFIFFFVALFVWISYFSCSFRTIDNGLNERRKG